MKKIIIYSILFTSLIFLSSSVVYSQNTNAIADKIRLIPGDIPEGFIYGLIPDGAKNILKDNPWTFDKPAIEKLTEKIYPGGDFNQVSGIHITILARKETPHRDDIVCYIIQYRSFKAAKDEVKKLADFAGNNQDRAILHVKDDYVIFLFADDTNNVPLLRELDKKITERMDKN
jgi:hypothetical protein